MDVTFHIGAPKTGTSALQCFLSRNRALLPFSYPAGRGDLRACGGETTTGNAFDLACQVEVDPTGAAASLAEGTVYSGERFWTVPLPALKSWLAPLASRVVIYARPQVSQLAASYFQRVRFNGFTGTAQDWIDVAAPRKLYAKRYETLGEVSSVVMRKYTRRDLVGGDIVDDFFAGLGLPIPAGVHRFPAINPTPKPLLLDRETALRVVEYFWQDNEKLDRLVSTPFDLNAENLRLAMSLPDEPGAPAGPSAAIHHRLRAESMQPGAGGQA